VEFNEANGGSFSVIAALSTSQLSCDRETIERILEQGRALGLDTPAPFAILQQTIDSRRKQLRELLEGVRPEGKTVLGYGASTKRNVLLQYWGIDRTLLPAIAEMNEDKFRSYTPGTRIPIVLEREAMAECLEYYLVLPWHFRTASIEREQAYLSTGGTFISPLRQLGLVSAEATEIYVC